jgi:hypothetical protein
MTNLSQYLANAFLFMVRRQIGVVARAEHASEERANPVAQQCGDWGDYFTRLSRGKA